MKLHHHHHHSSAKMLLRSPFSRLSNPLFYSTETLASKPETLYSRLVPKGDPRASILPILDQWIEEGNPVKKTDLIRMITQFVAFRRFRHALEISQWMTEKQKFVLSPSNLAVRLNLISRVHGITEAEKYFDTIPKESKTTHIYGALLNCYAQKKSIEKAEALMQQMRDLELTMVPVNYNVLLNCYYQLGKYDKLDALMEEMKDKGVEPDKFTFSIRLSAYAAKSNIDGMETTLKTMEENPKVIMDWHCYVIASNGYIKIDLIDKAVEMLKKAEELIPKKKKSVSYDYLLTMYAHTGRKEELYRIWDLYKASEKMHNKAYLFMISSLLKLDDIVGAEEILEEWELGDHTYDFRVPNLLFLGYCKKGMFMEAETLVRNEIKKGNTPYSVTWNNLATGYVEGGQIPKAVEIIMTACPIVKPGWKLNGKTLLACLRYMKEQGDLEKAEELVKLLESHSHITEAVCKKHLDYIHNSEVDLSAGSTKDGDDA
ncbi:hypothetical protein ACHQM5_017341 [Ranunculus cassubicifolius]